MGQIDTYVLFAFGFGNLAMLGWLAAAAAPLLIHLWSQHRFREAPWAAMQFLLAAMRKNARRLQLQQWLLLAVRTLIILLVVLAVAEPYGERLLAGGNTAPAHKVLVIDGSYSMAYRANGNTNFTKAKQMAQEMIRASHSGDVFTIVLMTSAPKFIVNADLFDRAAVAAQIESLTQPHSGADLAAALALVHEALSEAADRKLPVRKEVYVFTDLQRKTWKIRAGDQQSTTGKMKQSDTAKLINSIAKRASLVVINLGQANATNLAITNFTASDPAITIGRDIGFDAMLHNFSPDPRAQCSVEFLVDDVPVGEQTVNVAAGSDASVHFLHRFASAGSHTLTARTSGDRLDIDNSRSIIVPVHGAIRVLCVAGRDGAAKYLASALNPNPAGNSPIRPIIIAEGDLAETDLSNFDCVFLCNIAQLTPNEAERLSRYAEAGGGVVIFLGDRVVPSSYNAIASPPTIAPKLQPPFASLVPARIGPLAVQQQFGLDPLEYRHPIVAPFRGRERAGLLTTPINRYYRLEISQNRPGVEVAIAMQVGDPFIVTAPLGRGRTVLVATDASLSSVDPTNGEPWTTWPTWPSFLPIVRELLAYAIGGQQAHWQQLVGTPLGGPIGETTSPNTAALQIIRPDGRAAPVSVQSTPTGGEWSYANTDVSGIYSLRGLPQGRMQQFAVNVDTAESDLFTIDPRLLPPELKVRSTLQGETSSGATQSISQSEWNQSFLWGVLALLFAESFMAWHFGRGVV